MYYSLYNWIGEHDITKPKKIFTSNPERREKRTQKQAQNDMNEMTQNGLFDIFSNAHA